MGVLGSGLCFDFLKIDHMALFTVFGSPISHSLSPQIHKMFADEFGLLNEYRRSLSSRGQFARAVACFFRSGGAGANVTVPFKEQAFELVTHLTERARHAGAVNTLLPLGIVKYSAGQVLGDNTDGLGLLRDLQRYTQVSNRKLVILGAGGAARGVVLPLLEAGVAQLTIANRTPERAQAIVDSLPSQWRGKAQATGLDQIPTADILIQATSVMQSSDQALALPAKLAASAALCYDMSYAAQPTPFLAWAATQGASQQVDGLGMLVEQAALSFALWHDGLMPHTQPIIEQLRQGLIQQAQEQA